MFTGQGCIERCFGTHEWQMSLLAAELILFSQRLAALEVSWTS